MSAGQGLQGAGGTPATAEGVITEWIGRHLGARVLKIERQGRWRPCWFVEADRNGEALSLYIRGERVEDFLPYSLRRETEVHRLLQAGGVRTPRLYGLIEALPAAVMDNVPGCVAISPDATPEQMHAIREQLLDQTVLIHALDVAPFQAAGLRTPQDPIATTLSTFDDMYGQYLGMKDRPDPRLAFSCAWVRRNARPAAEAPRVIMADAGQFLSKDGVLTALYDFELTVLGDPWQDLAAFRARTVWQPMGDVASLIERYGEKSGRPVDLQRIRFHTASFMTAAVLGAAMNFACYRADPSPDADYVEFKVWQVLEQRQALEAIAEHMGLVLAPPTPPEPTPGWADEVLFALDAMIASRTPVGELEQYRLSVQRKTTTYLGNLARHGRAMEAAYVDDVASYLKASPADAAEADLLLERHIEKAGAEEDEALLQLVYADVCRQAFLLTMPGSFYNEPLMTPLPRL